MGESARKKDAERDRHDIDMNANGHELKYRQKDRGRNRIV